jgi:hypothetical protein
MPGLEAARSSGVRRMLGKGPTGQPVFRADESYACNSLDICQTHTKLQGSGLCAELEGILCRVVCVRGLVKKTTGIQSII